LNEFLFYFFPFFLWILNWWMNLEPEVRGLGAKILPGLTLAQQYEDFFCLMLKS
jgi:hypothetical protein